jgi:hypothetical protein
MQSTIPKCGGFECPFGFPILSNSHAKTVTHRERQARKPVQIMELRPERIFGPSLLRGSAK